MATVQTQAQANNLNKTGTYGPYLAANGHTMLAQARLPVIGLDEDCASPCPLPIEREYRIGDEIRYESWSAWCASDCGACREGYPLEDW